MRRQTRKQTARLLAVSEALATAAKLKVRLSARRMRANGRNGAHIVSPLKPPSALNAPEKVAASDEFRILNSWPLFEGAEFMYPSEVSPNQMRQAQRSIKSPDFVRRATFHQVGFRGCFARQALIFDERGVEHDCLRCVGPIMP